MTIDPLARWRPLPDKPDYAGFLSFGGAPIAAGARAPRGRRRRDRRSADGRPRLRPAGHPLRAAGDPRGVVPAGPHLEAGIDAFAELRIVDYGDAPVIPADPARLARGDRAASSARWSTPASLPVTLGGDHSITEPCASRRRRAARAARADPLRHAHRHRHARSSASSARTGRRCTASSRPARSTGARYAQIGLRGYWPGPAEFDWQRERGIASFFMHDVRDLGHSRGRRARARARGGGPGLPDRRRRRARPGVRTGDGHARAGRHDVGRPPVGGARDRRRASSWSAPTSSR